MASLVVTARLVEGDAAVGVEGAGVGQRAAADRIGAVERQAVQGADRHGVVGRHRQIGEGDAAVGVEGAGVGQRAAADRIGAVERQAIGGANR